MEGYTVNFLYKDVTLNISYWYNPGSPQTEDEIGESHYVEIETIDHCFENMLSLLEASIADIEYDLLQKYHI